MCKRSLLILQIFRIADPVHVLLPCFGCNLVKDHFGDFCVEILAIGGAAMGIMGVVL